MPSLDPDFRLNAFFLGAQFCFFQLCPPPQQTSTILYNSLRTSWSLGPLNPSLGVLGWVLQFSPLPTDGEHRRLRCPSSFFQILSNCASKPSLFQIGQNQERHISSKQVIPHRLGWNFCFQWVKQKDDVSFVPPAEELALLPRFRAASESTCRSISWSTDAEDPATLATHTHTQIQCQPLSDLKQTFEFFLKRIHIVFWNTKINHPR